MDLRIVSLGKTGVGRSQTGNTIFGDPNAFQTKCSAASLTVECQSATAQVKGRTIQYVDTPGFSQKEELRTEILKCIAICDPGPHCFLLQLKVERYTDQEEALVRKITEKYGEAPVKYTVVLFTHGENLDEGQTIEEFVKENSELQKLVDRCGGRCHVIDNKYWNRQQHEYRNNRVQIERLMETIDKMVRENEEGCYTVEMLEEAERNPDIVPGNHCQLL